jgi:hypothetical protein
MSRESIFHATVALLGAAALCQLPTGSGYAQESQGETADRSNSPVAEAPMDAPALPTTSAEDAHPHNPLARQPLFAASDAAVALLPDPLPLDWCLERAQQSNPSIAVDEAAAAAAAHRVSPAGALEDPRFSYEASNIPVGDFDFNSDPMSGNQLALMQNSPFPGVLSNREKAARAGASDAIQDLQDQRLRVAAVVEGRWAELGFAQRALEITDTNIGLLRQLTEIAEIKYSVGSGLQQDVLRSQVELTRLLEERLRRIEAIRASESQLAAVLGLPLQTVFTTVSELRDDSLAFASSRDALEDRALEAIACGVSTRKYRRSLERLAEDLGEQSVSKSVVSRRFVALSQKQMIYGLTTPLGDLASSLEANHPGAAGYAHPAASRRPWRSVSKASE